MSKSPNLSEQVLLETIEKEYDLPNILVKQILESNPQAAKSTNVLDRMEDKLIPFDEYQKAEIIQGLQWVSQKEMLEADMSTILHKREWAMAATARDIALDETIEDKVSALLQYLEPEVFLSDAIRKAEIELGLGDYIGAIASINAGLSNFILKPETHQELTDWLSVLELKNTLESNQFTTLTESQFSTLEDFFLNAASIPATYAYGMLQQYAGYEYEEPLYEFAFGVENRSSLVGMKHSSGYSVFPNPTSGLLVIRRSTEEPAEVEITDLTGKVVLNKMLAAMTKENSLDLSMIGSGFYTLTIRSLYGEILFVDQIVKE